jgi:transcriptional regulator with XRE-family HTH domain
MKTVSGAELERLRTAMGLSQRALAEELGVHPMSVSKWERGVHSIPEPVARLVERLARERRKPRKKR